MSKLISLIFLFSFTVGFSACEPVERLPIIDFGYAVYSPKELAILKPMMAESAVEQVVLLGTPIGEFVPAMRGNRDASVNTENALAMALLDPSHIFAFPDLTTVSTPQALEQMMTRGARGFSLVLDAPILPEMRALFPILNEKKIPLVVSLKSEGLRPDLESMFNFMKETPIVCLELCQSVESMRYATTLASPMTQLENLFTRHANLYAAIGFRNTDLLEKVTLAISSDPKPLRELILRHPSKFVVASNGLIGPNTAIDTRAPYDAWRGYRRMFAKAHYHFPVISRRLQKRGIRLDSDGALNGLFLPPNVLKAIYRDNAARLLSE